MSHQEKQSIFNQLSQNIDPETIRQGPVPLDHFEDWEDLLLAFRYSNVSLQSLTKIIFESCDIVQEEQQKRIAEKARIQQESCGDSMTCGCMGKCDYPVSYINKKSIINPENKIQ